MGKVLSPNRGCTRLICSSSSIFTKLATSIIKVRETETSFSDTNKGNGMMVFLLNRLQSSSSPVDLSGMFLFQFLLCHFYFFCCALYYLYSFFQSLHKSSTVYILAFVSQALVIVRYIFDRVKA